MKYIWWFLSGSMDAPSWMSGLLALAWATLGAFSYLKHGIDFLTVVSMAACASRITLFIGLVHKPSATNSGTNAYLCTPALIAALDAIGPGIKANPHHTCPRCGTDARAGYQPLSA